MHCPYCGNENKQKYPSNLYQRVHCGECGKYHPIKMITAKITSGLAREGGRTMEYTKGEWEAVDVSNQPHGYTRAVFMEDVALCDVLEYDVNPDEIVANAHLIAAAPNLYEALKLTVDWFAEVQAYIPAHAFTLSKIEQALAKAEGKA